MDRIISLGDQWATRLVEILGYAGITLLVALETLIPPVPSELVLGFTGFKVASGEMTFPFAVAAATAGSLGGALLLYACGRWFGEARLRHFVRRTGRYVLVTEGDLDRALAWFKTHGPLSVFICRFIPGLRSFISFPAGITEMPVLRFTAYTALGSTIWNAALIAAGWMLHHQWEQIGRHSQIISVLVAASLVAAIVIHLIRRRRDHPAPAPSQDRSST